MAFIDDHYLMKKWCMWELGLVLERGSDKNQQVLLPVLAGRFKAFEEIDQVVTDYDNEEKWKEKNQKKPETEELNKWKSWVKQLKSSVFAKGSQVE